MSDAKIAEQQLQSILKNISVGGNLTTGDISQILNLFVIVHQPNSFIPKSTPYNIPSSNTIKFVGRADALEQLHQALQQNSQVAITAIEGMGGVGKTELATQYSLLHLLLNTYPGGICWLRARDEDIAIQILRFAEAKLGIKPPENWDIKSQIDFCWSRWQEKKQGNVLIVLDDVNDYPEIQPYLPPQLSQFKILITTRLQLDLPQSFSLDILSEFASLELLRQWIGEEKVNEQLVEAKELCLRLGYLPLALNLVGRYVQKRKISVTEILQRLEAKGLQHKALDVDKKDRTRTLNIQRGVAAAFELSWEELSNNAQQLGCLLSLFALAPIPWSLVESAAVGHDSEELEDARVELENLHLLQSGEDTYQLHQLIQEFFRDKQNNLTNADRQKSNFCSAIVAVAKEIPFDCTLTDINYFTPFTPHITEIVDLYLNWLKNEDLIKPFLGLGRFYEGQGAYAEALSVYKRCLSVVEKRLGRDHTDRASSLNNLAGLYRLQSRYEEAEPLYLQALEYRKKLIEEENYYDLATILNDLAVLYRLQCRYKEAEPYYLQALEYGKKLLGKEYCLVALILNNLAIFYKSQGKYSEAESFYLKSLDIYKKLLGEEHPSVANSLNNLAVLYRRLNRYSEAEFSCLKALKLRQKLLGEEHYDVAVSLNNLAVIYNRQEKYIEAEPLYLKALDIYEKLLGKEHPDLASSLDNLAGLYRLQGRYSEAESLCLRALELRQKLLGEEHYDVAISLNNLAEIYLSQGKYDKAETLYVDSLKVRKKVFGEKNSNVTIGLNNLAEFYLSQEKYDKAEPLYLQALEIAEQVLGTDHAHTNIIRTNYEKLKERLR